MGRLGVGQCRKRQAAQPVADQRQGLGHHRQDLRRPPDCQAGEGQELHFRIEEHDPVPTPDSPARHELQGPRLEPAQGHTVLHRHLPAGQERARTSGAGGG
ncbi:hypothetical protein D3C81_1993320 [compost metagenome]